MKHNVVLTITSLLSILFLTLHITDDIVRGISKAEPSNIALAVLVALLYGTLVLAERRSGYVIMLLVGLFAAAMPVMHRSEEQRLNSSHMSISYAVFCLKKKKTIIDANASWKSTLLK